MSGNDQVRFCQHCNLHVTDLSTMTRPNAMRLVARSQGRLCVRYVQLPGGGVLTRTPARLYRIGRRVSRLAASAFSASLTLSSAAAQTGSRPELEITRQTSAVAKVISAQAQGTSLSGVITDPNGAVVSGATVTLVNNASSVSFTFRTVDDGVYKFAMLDAGVYALSVEASGFTKIEVREIKVEANSDSTIDLAVTIPALTETVEIRGSVTIQSQGMGGAVGVVVPEDPLIKAAFQDDLDLVKQLALTSADVNISDRATDQTALAGAVENGNREMVRVLLAAGADINARNRSGQTPLMFLPKKADLDFVRELIAAGADVNATDQHGQTPLLNAAASSSFAVFQALISYGARMSAKNSEDTTLLMRAAENDDQQIALLLLKSGVDVNAQDQNKETALLIAANWGNASIIKVLVDARADVDAKDGDGRTALLLAAGNEDQRMAQLLIEAGADVNVRDEDENTALMIATEHDRVQTIKALIEAGAKLDAINQEGQTALMQAGSAEAVLLLINAGADLTIKDKEGKTALSVANDNERGDVVKLLKARGASQ
jgi:ankyrin repeat protein